jgi:hypothetical protein
MKILDLEDIETVLNIKKEFDLLYSEYFKNLPKRLMLSESKREMKRHMMESLKLSESDYRFYKQPLFIIEKELKIYKLKLEYKFKKKELISMRRIETVENLLNNKLNLKNEDLKNEEFKNEELKTENIEDEFKNEKLKKYRKDYYRLKINSEKHLKERLFKFLGSRDPVHYERFKEKFKDNLKCFYTGIPLSFNDKKSYSFDHFVAKSKGGEDNLSNLRICSREINYMKGALSYDQFIYLCGLVYANHLKNYQNSLEMKY